MAGIARIDSAADQNITTRNTGQKMTLGTVALSTGTDVDTGTASTIKALTAGNYLVMAAADVSVGATSNTTYVGIAKGGSYSSGLLAYSYKKCDSPKLKCANIVALAANDALTMMGRYDNSSSQTTTYIPGIEEQHGTTTYLSAVKLSGDVAKLIKSSGTQNISATTDTVVTGSSDATVTTGSTFTVSGNKITANVATPVLVVWSVGWSAGSAIFHICGVRLNGGNWISYDSNSDLNGSPTTTPKLNGAFALQMAAGDYLELMAYREASGTTQTVTGTSSLGQETYLCVAAVTDMIRLDQSSDQSITPDTSSTGVINYLLNSPTTQTVTGSIFTNNGDGTVSVDYGFVLDPVKA